MAKTSHVKAYQNVPPLRAEPFTEDEHDALRVQFVRDRFHGQDNALRRRDRQIEENVRMLCGQQWTVWSDMLSQFVDISRYMSADEIRWRQRPVLNKLLFWYILTHARLTENPPVISFLPSSGDRHDAELAETLDTIHKAKWSEVGMLEVIDRLVAWLIPGGRAHLKSRIDREAGELIPWRGPGVVPVLGPDGQPTGVQAVADDVAFNEKGEPVSVGFQDEMGFGVHEPEGVEAHAERRGDLAVDVLSPLEVRGEWGPRPWHQKRWHIHRSFMTPEDVYDAWGIEVEPDVTVGSDDSGPGELARLMMGAGFFGAANGDTSLELEGAQDVAHYVSVYEMWERPCSFPGMQESEKKPGGRLTIIAGDKVARDGQRIARFKHTSPIRCFDFVNVPGRPSGTTPQESLNSIQRAFNRTTAQQLQHAALSSDPKAMIHQSSGITEDQWNNEPGTAYIVRTEPGVEPVTYAAPPPLGEDVHRTHQFLGETLDRLGHIEGAEGRPPSRDASGELVKELRSNSDRPIASTARRAVLELGRMVDDWIVLLPLTMDEETVIAYAGEDQVVRTVTVYPELFERGRVNVQPDIESMLPEGRGERQQRVYRMYLDGIFGLPGSPDAISTFLDFARFPHLGRNVRPGGAERITAEQNNGRLARGAAAAEVPFFEWYDPILHLAVLESWMKAPEWLRATPDVQRESVLYRMRLLERAQAAQAAALVAEAETALVADTAAHGAAQGAAEVPQDPTTDPTAGAGPSAKPGQPVPPT